MKKCVAGNVTGIEVGSCQLAVGGRQLLLRGNTYRNAKANIVATVTGQHDIGLRILSDAGFYLKTFSD